LISIRDSLICDDVHLRSPVYVDGFSGGLAAGFEQMHADCFSTAYIMKREELASDRKGLGRHATWSQPDIYIYIYAVCMEENCRAQRTTTAGTVLGQADQTVTA
jgi:hypothetical protein